MNIYNLLRGTICVQRAVMYDNQTCIEWLALENQNEYKEWIGCFSVL